VVGDPHLTPPPALPTGTGSEIKGTDPGVGAGAGCIVSLVTVVLPAGQCKPPGDLPSYPKRGSEIKGSEPRVGAGAGCIVRARRLAKYPGPASCHGNLNCLFHLTLLPALPRLGDQRERPWGGGRGGLHRPRRGRDFACLEVSVCVRVFYFGCVLCVCGGV